MATPANSEDGRCGMADASTEGVCGLAGSPSWMDTYIATQAFNPPKDTYGEMDESIAGIPLHTVGGIKYMFAAPDTLLACPTNATFDTRQLGEGAGEGAVLYVHGRDVDLAGIAEHLATMATVCGRRVYAFDPPGYGRSAGQITDSWAAAARLVAAQIDGPVVVWGHSMGAWAAAEIGKDAAVVGVVLEAAFTSLFAARQGWMPWSGQLVGLDRLCVADTLAQPGAPVAIVHGEDDSVVAPSHAFANAAAAHGVGRLRALYFVPGVGHAVFFSAAPVFATIIREMFNEKKRS